MTDDRPSMWGKNKRALIDWYHTCPYPWVAHWYEGGQGSITIHVVKHWECKEEDDEEEEELTPSQKLDKARGR